MNAWTNDQIGNDKEVYTNVQNQINHLVDERVHM